MNLVSLTVARNEACFIGLSLRVALKWCDSSVILLHSCVDRTREIVEQVAAENPGRVRILEDNNAWWSEMAHRQATLDEARRMGATHCAVVDADEVLTGDLLPNIRAEIESVPASRHLGIRMFNLHRSIGQFRSDTGVWGKQAGTMISFTDSPDLTWRPASDGYDHHHRHPRGSRFLRKIGSPGGVMHLQFASWRRLTAKHALYKMTERIRWPHKPVAEIDRLYNMALDEAGAEVQPTPAEWWAPYADLMQHLDVNAEPWQEAECQRLWDALGPAPFNGLNLFGLVGQEVAA